MTKLITVYAKLDDVISEIEDDDVFRELYNRARSLARHFAIMIVDDPEKAERLMMAFTEIFEPNGYKIIKEARS